MKNIAYISLAICMAFVFLGCDPQPAAAGQPTPARATTSTDHEPAPEKSSNLSCCKTESCCASCCVTCTTTCVEPVLVAQVKCVPCVTTGYMVQAFPRPHIERKMARLKARLASLQSRRLLLVTTPCCF